MKKSKLQLIFAIGATIFTLLPVLAPIFAYLGLNFLADSIYSIYQFFCHQRPWRSYHLFDYQYAMDARMTFMFGSLAISSFVIYFKNLKPLKPINALVLGIIFITPLGIDGTIQAIAEVLAPVSELPFYESTNFIRSLTGSFFGIGLGFAALPYLNQTDGLFNFRDYIAPALATLAISLMLVPIIVFFWFITSNKYLPSTPFVDSVQRYPGYNYEITTGAGHSPITRIIRENDEFKYINRAKALDRQDLIDDYKNEN